LSYRVRGDDEKRDVLEQLEEDEEAVDAVREARLVLVEGLKADVLPTRKVAATVAEMRNIMLEDVWEMIIKSIYELLILNKWNKIII